MNRRRLAVLISGRGSNMQALLDASQDPAWPCKPVLVLSNRPGAAGLLRARDFGVTTLAIDHRAFAGREAFEAEMHTALLEAGVELVALAGFMRVLTPGFVDAWSGRMVNIHPSLLPAYPGTDTHRRVLEAGESIHGCSVHWVTPGVDEGPVIGRAEIGVLPDDTPDSLAQRVLRAEHLLYPPCVAAAAGIHDALVDQDLGSGPDAIRLRRAKRSD